MPAKRQPEPPQVPNLERFLVGLGFHVFRLEKLHQSTPIYVKTLRSSVDARRLFFAYSETYTAQ